jgi:hypothetical protein
MQHERDMTSDFGLAFDRRQAAMLRPAPYLSQKLTRPIPTKDGGTLRTALDARAYMLGISDDRQLRSQ